MPPAERTDWQTPPEVFEPLHHEFEFEVDACASPTNALLPRYWTIDDDALVQDWGGLRVWCNPPYGREQVAFVAKAAERRAGVAVLLIPARTDTRVWHDMIFGAAEVRFLRGRVRFLPAGTPAPFPSAVVVFRGANLRKTQ